MLAIQDALLPDGLSLLRQAVDQGAISLLTSALDYQSTATNALGLKVALEGLRRYLKVFQKVQRPCTPKDIKDNFGADLGVILDKFEQSYGGVEKLEKCQYHFDDEVYRMAQKIILRFFE